MSLSALGSSQSQSLSQIVQERRQALKSMMDAVQSGDMKSAQASATTAQIDTSQITSALGQKPSSGSGNPFRTTIKNDLSNLMQAVQGGDLTQSQAALGTLNADGASAHGAAPVGASDPDGDGDGKAASGGSAFMKDLVGLLTSMSSGDMAGAKTAATALQADIQSLSGTPAAAGSLGNSSADSDGDSDGSSQQAATTQAAPSTQQPNSFLQDLGSLISSAQSGDLTSAQKAAGTLATDLQSALSSLDQTQGAHHHHHDAGDAGSAPPPPADASAMTSSSSTGASPPEASHQGPRAKAVQNVLDAYQLLMGFSQGAASSSAASSATTP